MLIWDSDSPIKNNKKINHVVYLPTNLILNEKIEKKIKIKIKGPKQNKKIISIQCVNSSNL
jgi:hypothetical protein